ncbi:MAG: YfcE family phosphodiesterase [Lachnospiraceae bacterium]|nr:YfcE family phosphodiesterase [Lachnospiraceae bacterium]
MRRILACSDIHGFLENFIKVLEREPDIDAILVAGDIEMKTEELKRAAGHLPCYIVRGNCDYYYSRELPDELVINECGHRILLTHGHLYGVPRIARIRSHAKEAKCDMIVFGHTHQYFERMVDGIMFLNPGMLKGRPEWGTQSYMLIDFNNDGSIDIIKKRLR